MALKMLPFMAPSTEPCPRRVLGSDGHGVGGRAQLCWIRHNDRKSTESIFIPPTIALHGVTLHGLRLVSTPARLVADRRRAHSQSRRGIDEKTPVQFCCDRCNDARCYPCWVRHLRRGRFAISPRRPVWSMSTGLLARSWKAGVLDTTGPAGPIWRVPAKLSPWAIPRLVLGGLCRIGHPRGPTAAGSYWSSPTRH
jgi:hypothetical protein